MKTCNKEKQIKRRRKKGRALSCVETKVWYCPVEAKDGRCPVGAKDGRCPVEAEVWRCPAGAKDGRCPGPGVVLLELEQVLVQDWQNIPQAFLARLVRSMGRCDPGCTEALRGQRWQVGEDGPCPVCVLSEMKASGFSPTETLSGLSKTLSKL